MAPSSSIATPRSINHQAPSTRPPLSVIRRRPNPAHGPSHNTSRYQRHPRHATHLCGQAAVAVHVAEVHLATWRQHAVHLLQHPRLVWRQIDLQGRTQARKVQEDEQA